MQGRASKAPKKELVIESPQQYRSLAEAEVDTVPQVVVSLSTICFLKRGFDRFNLDLFQSYSEP